jgi:hypothetical protein
MRLMALTNTGDGLVHIHYCGCADLRKAIYRRTDKIDNGDTDWESKEAFGLDYWSDINAEQGDRGYDEGKAPTYVFEELKFFPCTNDLPKFSPKSEESS